MTVSSLSSTELLRGGILARAIQVRRTQKRKKQIGNLKWIEGWKSVIQAIAINAGLSQQDVADRDAIAEAPLWCNKMVM